MKRAWLLTAAAASVGGCNGCSSSPPDSGLPDAFDAPTPDAAPDGLDADATAPVVATGPMACAPADAAPANWSCPLVPVDGGQWAQLSCVPPSCSFRIALNPSAMMPALNWVPCTSGRPGCRELAPVWVSDPANFRVGVGGVGTYVGSEPRFWLDVVDLGANTEHLSLVGADDGGAAFLLSDVDNPTQPHLCLPHWAQQSVGSSAVFLDAFVTGTNFQQLLFQGPLTGGPAWSAASADFDQASCGLDGIVSVAASSAFVAVATAPGFTLRRFDQGSSRALVEATVDTINGNPFDPEISGSSVYFIVDSDGLRPEEIWALPFSGAPVRLVGLASSDAYAVSADSGQLVWLRGDNPSATRDGGYYTGVSLWTAPAVTDPSLLAPARLTSIPDGAYVLMHALGYGHYAFYNYPNGPVHIVNVADGSSWTIAADPGMAWTGYPAWVGPDEIALAEEVVPPPMYEDGLAQKLVRITYASLGPATPAVP